MRLLERSMAPVPVRLAAARPFHEMFQPVPRRWTPAPRRIGQIEFNPQIDAPVNIGLGTLPLSLGLFAASGMSFILGWQVPGIRSISSVFGVGLAGAGVLNLLFGKPSGPDGAGGPTVAPPPGTTAQASDPIPTTPEDAFAAITARVIQPTEGQEVDLSAWAAEIPVRIRLTNGSGTPAAFDLVLDLREDPTPGDEWDTRTSIRVSIGAGETRDIDAQLALSKWQAWVDYIDVDLVVSKRRISGGDVVRMDSRFFVIE